MNLAFNYVYPNSQSKRINSVTTVPKHDVKKNLNTILVVCDQLINYKKLPKHILSILPGYQAFSGIGIEFTNIYNNRQDCSPSRGSFQSSQLNINIGDNIDFQFQYEYNPQLSTNFDTIGKSLKRNGINTAYYGKNHFVSALATDAFVIPAFNINTRGCMRNYGFDIYNTYGDTYYYANQGYFADNSIFNFKVNNSLKIVDYADSTGKYIGAIPYLKSRVHNSQPFHLQLHLENPHDTQHFWQNFALTPDKAQLQYWAPYIDEQIKYINEMSNNNDAKNPYHYSNAFPQAYAKDPNLLKNYFENTFTKYITNTNSLPFKESFEKDYATNSESNSIFAFFAGIMASLKIATTIPTDENDIMSWKNLINNYYGLVIEADLYIYNLYKFLNNNNMLNSTAVTIISDHGELLSAHGLKQKGYHYDEGTNIACLVYSPHIQPNWRGKKCKVIGSLLDIAPTIDVLANVKNKSARFLGNSLLNWKLKNLLPRTNNNAVFNVYYSWMTYLSYFRYIQWYYTQPDNIKYNVISEYNPLSSFLKYLGFYTMIVDIVDGKKYKLARYFNFQELLLYNFIFNPKLQNISITLDYIISSISNDILKLSILNNYTSGLKLLLTHYFNNNTFNFNNICNTINTTQGHNSVYLFIFINAIINITKEHLSYSLMMPGYYNNTYAAYNSFSDYLYDPDANYYFFMHNLTDDPQETINMLDKSNRFTDRLTPENLSTGSLLNSRLNNLLEKYNIINFDFIIPNKILIAIAINIALYGNNFATYTDIQFKQISSCFGINKTDGDLKQSPYFDDIISVLMR